jgi:hypothetical protein
MRDHAKHFFIPSVLNSMADDASCLTHLSDAALLSHFNTHYPQNLPWRLLMPRPGMIFSGILGLLSLHAGMELHLHTPTPTTTLGGSGLTSAPTLWSTPPSNQTSTAPYISSLSSPTVTALGPLLSVADLLSLAQWKVLPVRWGRCWPTWGPLIPG